MIRLGSIRLALVFITVLAAATPQVKAEGYFTRMKSNFGRGFQNMVMAPVEIFSTVGEYHRESRFPPGISHLVGLGDGAFQAVERFGSGFWEVGAAFVPGKQDDVPLEEPPVLVRSQD